MGRIKERIKDHGKKVNFPSNRRLSRKKIARNLATIRQNRGKAISSIFLEESVNPVQQITEPDIATSGSTTHGTDTNSTLKYTADENVARLQPDEIFPEGRRLVDVGFLFRQIFATKTHPMFDCTICDMYVCREQRKGLQTIFILKCRMCGIEEQLYCNEENNQKCDINDTATLGAISVGTGYSGTEEFLATLNVPFMAPETFQVCHGNVANIINETAWDSMQEAARQEREMAIQEGNVDKDGIPTITVVADGAWSKRSYNVNYNAASGVACIIGHASGKLLYLQILNKYCCICARAETKETQAPDHMCYKNWSGPSTGMETAIIAEGFKRSVDLLGLKFTQLVGDGDSSVHRKLLETRPYGSTLVQKIECKNHLLRIFFKKIREIGSTYVNN